MIRRLKLPLLVLAALLVGFGYGFVAHRAQLFPYSLIKSAWFPDRPPGRWHTARGGKENGEEQMQELLALPYLQGYHTATASQGVTIHDPERARAGLNFYVSAHTPSATLMDMDGKVLHEWRYELDPATLDLPEGVEATYWRRAWLAPNGDVIAIYENAGLLRVDRDSNLLWRAPGYFHHDLFVGPEREIHALRHEAKRIERINPDELVLEDFLVTLDASGTARKSVSLLEAFERSSFAPILHHMKRAADILHTNTVEILDGSESERSPLFRKGNVLLSFRELDTIAILDPATETIVWALTGQWRKQHEPVLLPGGRMLLFDNLGIPDHSRVLELDPFTQAVAWSYAGSAERPFRSECCGTNQRLDNGNTLITESDHGRAFEVTPEGEIVWEFVSPHRAGEKGELVATLFELVRLPPEKTF